MNLIKWPKKILYYHVETLIFGDALNRALNPERIIIIVNLIKTSLIYMKYLNYLNQRLFI